MSTEKNSTPDSKGELPPGVVPEEGPAQVVPPRGKMSPEEEAIFKGQIPPAKEKKEK